jgi:hypothetical protein
MTRTDDFIGQLESYLDEYEGSTPLPEDVRDAVRAELPSIHQRPAWWPVRRRPTINNTMRLALATAAVVVAAIVGYSYLAGGNVGGPWIDEITPSPAATASPSAWNPGAGLEEGRNELVLDDVNLSIEVPAGWANMEFEGMIRYSPPSGGHYPWIGFLQTFDSVADDPCAASAIPVGPSVDDLAEGLTTIPGTEASEPSDTAIGGVPAKFVELTINDDIACAPNSFWLYGPNSAWPNSLDTTIRVWVFELDGTRYVIHSDLVGDDPRVADMIVDVVESIEFEPTP